MSRSQKATPSKTRTTLGPEKLIKKSSTGAVAKNQKSTATIRTKASSVVPSGKADEESTKPINNPTTSRPTAKPTAKPTTKPTTSASSPGLQQLKAPAVVARTSNKLAVPTRKPVSRKAQPAPSTQSHQSSQLSGPLRAKHTAAIVEAIKHNAIRSPQRTNKTNAVLDTYHNVTVSSPPMRRKEVPASSDNFGPSAVDNGPKRVRTRTRTLDPDEVVVLRRESAKKRSEDQLNADADAEAIAEVLGRQVKEPVSFDVYLDDENASEEAKPRRERSTNRQSMGVPQSDAADDDPANYSDDFESYESDFETGSSSPSTSATPSSAADSESNSGSAEPSSRRRPEAATDVEESDDDDESETTQYPVTVIPNKDKERDRQLDSGNYELNTNTARILKDLSQQQQQPQPFDSLDTFSATTSDQLDSGISSFNNEKQHKSASFYEGYRQFNTKPFRSKRGAELMAKLQFDCLTFSLFEQKPISYDVFMQTYGRLNTTQSSSQTNDNRTATDCQTDDCATRTMWTQHPPQYDLATVAKLTAGLSGTHGRLNCCDEEDSRTTATAIAGRQQYSGREETRDGGGRDPYDRSLRALSMFREDEARRAAGQQVHQTSRPVNIERLNAFLMNASMLIAKVLTAGRDRRGSLGNATTMPVIGGDASRLPAALAERYATLDTQFLNALRTVKVFANAMHGLVVTVHETLPDADVYRSDFANLLMVWTSAECRKPLRLLSTWSEVCRVEISNDCAEIVVGGLQDGSLALWDLRETYSFCPKLDGSLTHFAATQSIAPTWGSARHLHDLGSMVDIRSFRVPPKSMSFAHSLTGHKSIQFASLNDVGILAVWTLVESVAPAQQQQRRTSSVGDGSQRGKVQAPQQFEYSTPWAKVRLVQSSICHLREYLETSILKSESQFEKTKSLFQKNIYSDEILRELTQTPSTAHRNNELRGLRFTAIDTGCERIYVCTNRDFVVACSKSLKAERFRKIVIDDSRFLFATALCVLSNEDFLAVGLSNGSVVILNCNFNKPSSQLGQHLLPTPSSMLRRSSATSNAMGANATHASPIDLETGKSCAIQNIILAERRSFDQIDVFEEPATFADFRPDTAACIALITSQQKPFELRVHDQQTVLSGSVLRQHLVQALALSADGWRLFALANGHVRSYDFCLDRELDNDNPAAAAADSDDRRPFVVAIAVARSSAIDQHLVTLDKEARVELHLLKK